LTVLFGAGLVSCTPARFPTLASTVPVASSPRAVRDGPAEFARVEEESLRWLAAADARMAGRLGLAAAPWMLDRIRTDAVLQEDVKAVVRGGSLDLFAFEERHRVLDRAAALAGELGEGMLTANTRRSVPARPQLERELALRLIAEEQARLDDERQLGEASGSLVRGLVQALNTPASEDETGERDIWVADRLREIRGALGGLSTRGARRDLDAALYPLERALPPLEFPKATAAIADLRIAMDADSRPLAELPSVADILHRSGTYLGVAVTPDDLDARLVRLTLAIDAEIEHRRDSTTPGEPDSDSATAGRSEVEARAQQLLLIADSCPCDRDTRLGRIAPSPERGGLCGALRALNDKKTRAGALVALHDDIVIARTIVSGGVHVRSALLSHPPSEVVDDLLNQARTRPIFVLGIALAAELVYGSDDPDERLACWERLGDAPLDIVRRECSKLRH